MQVNGTITNVRSVQKQSKSGRPFYIKYLTVDGFDSEINIGWEKGYDVGGTFNKDIIQNQYGEWVPNKGDSSGGAAPAQQSNKPVRVASAEAYPLPADHPKNVIVNQNSMAHATALAIHIHRDSNDPDQILATTLQLAAEITRFSTGRSTADKVAELLQDQQITEVANG